MAKDEIAHYDHFLLLSQYFQMPSAAEISKCVSMTVLKPLQRHEINMKRTYFKT